MTINEDADPLFEIDTPQFHPDVRAERTENLISEQTEKLKSINSKLEIIQWCALVCAIALATIAWK